MIETITLETAPDPMTPDEVAVVTRLGRSTIYDLIKTGAIRHQRAGTGRRAPVRVYKADLRDWIETTKRGGGK